MSLAEEIFNQILINTYTLLQLKKRLRLLKLITEERLYHNQTTPDLLSLTSSQTDIAWLKNLPEKFLDQITVQNITELFEELLTLANKQEVLICSIAFEMPEAEIDKLGQKLRNDYGEKLLFNLKTDPSIIAGCTLIWKGKHMDYSIKKKIDSSQPEIIKEIGSFIRH